MLKEIAELLNLVEKKKPLVHHITNYVTANDCANIVLSLGGSPVMADDPGEVEDMVSCASVLVLNIGTLSERKIKSMLKAGKKANDLNIPVILDPVGVGATSMRRKAAFRLIKEIKLSVIRGNMSEIKALAGLDSAIKGVDSMDTAHGAGDIALSLAQNIRCVTAITGEKDFISDGNTVCIIENGHKMLTHVTGTGCMSTSLIGAYCGVNRDGLLSTAAGILTMGIAAEIAYQSLDAPESIGTFKMRLFDSVYNMKEEDIIEMARITLN